MDIIGTSVKPVVKAGTPAGTPAGTKADTQAGTLAGTPAGTKAGTKEGTLVGTKAGTKAGTPAGTLANTPAGTPAGTPTGKQGGKLVKRSTNLPPKHDNTQLWKKGPTKKFLQNGAAGKEYFTLTNLYDKMVLTAVEGPPASLEIKSKPNETRYSTCQIICRFLQISVKSVAPLLLSADSNMPYSF